MDKIQEGFSPQSPQNAEKFDYPQYMRRQLENAKEHEAMEENGRSFKLERNHTSEYKLE